ncbi:hypothetical protein HFO56_23240 [Rhizobium laguerreae]|uniref:Ig domain-containing protein n=1 Tax=Rhizobium laguerreae TaxID=1076926 RepID=UPI001C90C60C|nr:Ig domain-containing protein [Rhizobium laguerreae]MBY3155241.1 hypothetical protein [Rhizobium laguerreae]
MKKSWTLLCALLLATSTNTAQADEDRFYFRQKGGVSAFQAEPSQHPSEKVTINGVPTTFYADDDLNVALSASGGSSPYKWSIQGGSLPSGVDLTEDGRIHGKASGSGEYNFTLGVSDANGISSSASASITVYDRPSILRDELNPPNFVRYAPWRQTYSFKGAKTETATVSVTGLPTGLSYTVDNTEHSIAIAGTPTVEGFFPIEISLVDGSGVATQFPDDIVVTSPITVTGAPTVFYRNEPLDYTLVASGGNGGPYSFKAGPYPDYGVNTTVSADGRVTGSFSNSYFEELLITDVAGVTSKLIIKDYNPLSPLNVTTYSISGGPQGYRMTTYPIENTQFNAQGGKAPYTWSTNASDLPPGTSFTAQGIFSGTPAAAGTYDFVVEVTDANGRKASRNIQLSISSCGWNCLN